MAGTQELTVGGKVRRFFRKYLLQGKTFIQNQIARYISRLFDPSISKLGADCSTTVPMEHKTE